MKLVLTCTNCGSTSFDYKYCGEYECRNCGQRGIMCDTEEITLEPTQDDEDEEDESQHVSDGATCCTSSKLPPNDYEPSNLESDSYADMIGYGWCVKCNYYGTHTLDEPCVSCYWASPHDPTPRESHWAPPSYYI